MKKVNYFFAIISTAFLCSVTHAQNFVRIDETQTGKQISVASDQVLEVQLPVTPSTGYTWTLRDSNNEITQQANGVIEQIGDWEFISDNPDQPVGSSGKQIIRYISKTAGTVNLDFSYSQPWTIDAALQHYKVSVQTNGKYNGTYKAPVIKEVKAENNRVNGSYALPAKFSWLEQKMMTPVKNQGSCGSCWAFAACGQFEANIKRFDGVTRDLSEQFLVNCAESGCSGGWCPDYIFKSKGAVYEADLPYKAKDGTCGAYTYHEKIISYKEIAKQPTVTQLKEAIYQYGPLWVTVCVGSNFSAYKNGVLTKTDAGSVNHAVVLCGWDDATESWVMRNSWGSSWGEQGYMRIKFGVCNIGYRGSYMIYKDASTGIDENETAGAGTVYPNPVADGKLTINLNHFPTNETVTITIHDVQGKLVYQQQQKQSGKVEVEMQSFDKGLYFVNLCSDSQAENYKFIKQ